MRRKVWLVAMLWWCAFMLGILPGSARGEQLAGVHLYVAPDGSDAADGSFAHPFSTFARAQLEVRALLRTRHEPITVNIREGEYYMGQPLALTEEDSGTPDAPVTWQAYGDEEVLLSGGIVLSPSSFERVSDPAILARIRDETVRKRLVQINLSGYLGDMPRPVMLDEPWQIQCGIPQVYIDGEALVAARYPNDVQNQAYLFADYAEALSDAPYAAATIRSEALADRMKGWSPNAWESMYVYSFLAWDWDDIVSGVAACDYASGTIVTATGASGPPTQHPRFYVFNLLEEIDLPGESYIDYENSIVYFYPPDDFPQARVRLSLQESPLIQLQHAQHITLRGLTLGYTCGVGIQCGWVEGVVVDDCTVAHTSNTGIRLDPAINSTVQNCRIYDTEECGIYLWDEDLRKTLTSGGNVLAYNDIYDNSRGRRAYQPAIWCSSMGVQIHHNTLHDNPGLLLDIGPSNDAIIEYNEFYNACRDASDAGAIYYGRNPSILGIRINYNYFHDIGNTYGGIGQQAIFCDDGATMPMIYGNVFDRASDQNPEMGAAIKANGAQFGTVEHNIFIDSPYAAFFQSWTFNWDRLPLGEDAWLANVYGTDDPTEHGIWKRLTEEVDFFSTAWKAHYQGTPWAVVWDHISPEGYDEAWRKHAAATGGYPFDYGTNPAYYDYFYGIAPSQTNLFVGNVCVNIGKMIHENGRGSDNLTLGTDIFVDYANGDFTLTPEALAEIRKTIPGFPQIPMDRIGRR